MPLSTKRKQELKSQAYSLKPVVLIGSNGLSDPVNQEIDRALYDHELIKVRIHSNDREVVKEILQQISRTQNALLIQKIGHIGVFYRESNKKK